MAQTGKHCERCLAPPCFCHDSGITGMFQLSPQGVILASNASVSRLLRRSSEELLGEHFDSLILPQDRVAVHDWYQDLRKNQRPTLLEARLLCRDGTLVHTLITVCHLPAPDDPCLLMILDITSHKPLEVYQLAKERRQRDILIREVHHRIKNNLQGIVGLLHNQILRHPEVAEILEVPIRQINSIALTYGLKSDIGDGRVFLCDLSQVTARSAHPSGVATLEMDIPHYRCIEVNDGEAVSIALVINELLFNAMKHGHASAGVKFSLRREKDGATVTVTNRYQGPPLTLDFITGKGLGTGLKLVKSLLPADGSAELLIRQRRENVVAELKLRPPLVRILK